VSDLPVWVEAGLALTALLQFLLLVFVVPIRGAIDRLKESDDRLRAEFADWKVHVASEYVRWDKVDNQHHDVLAAIRRLEALIQELQREKADK